MIENPTLEMVKLCEHMLAALRRLEIQLRSDDYNDVRELHTFISALKQNAEQSLGEANEPT